MKVFVYWTFSAIYLGIAFWYTMPVADYRYVALFAGLTVFNLALAVRATIYACQVNITINVLDKVFNGQKGHEVNIETDFGEQPKA